MQQFISNKKTMKNSSICRLIAIAIAGGSAIASQAQVPGGGETWPPPWITDPSTAGPAFKIFTLSNNFLKLEGVISPAYAKAWIMRWQTTQYQIDLAPLSDMVGTDTGTAGCLGKANTSNDPYIKMDLYDPATLAMITGSGSSDAIPSGTANSTYEGYIYINNLTNDQIFNTHYYGADNPAGLKATVTDNNTTVNWGINGYLDNATVIAAPQFTAGYTGNSGFGVDSQSTWTFTVSDIGGDFPTGGTDDICGTTVPVTLSYAYMSQPSSETAKFSWATDDETNNTGFHLWAKIDDSWQLLNNQILATVSNDSMEQNRYTWSTDVKGDIQAFGISQVDANGEESFFGPYTPGVRYGSAEGSGPKIPWKSIREELDANMTAQGFQPNEDGGYTRKTIDSSADVVLTALADVASAPTVSTDTTETVVSYSEPKVAPDSAKLIVGDFDLQEQEALATSQDAIGIGLIANLRVNNTGIVRVGFNELAAMNIDLSQVSDDKIAIVNRGEPVSRYIGLDSNNERFVEFYAEEVDGVALQSTRQNVYQITVDSSLVREPVSVSAVNEGNGSFIASAKVEEDKDWHTSYAPADDQWYMDYVVQMVRADGSLYNKNPVINGILVSNLSNEGYGIVTAEVLNAFDTVAGAEAEYNMYVNGTLVGKGNIDGNAKRYLRAIVPTSMLVEGDNSFEIRLNNEPGVTITRLFIDSVTIQYPTNAQATADLFVAAGKAGSTGYSIGGISSNADVTAYAFDAKSDTLYRLTPSRDANDNILIGSASSDATSLPDYWVGSAENLVSADVELINPITTTDIGDANYVIVTHENFTNTIETGYVGWKEGQTYFDKNGDEKSYKIAVVELKDIYDYYGGGLVDSSGIRNFLTDDALSNVEHVMLVGGASVDYGVTAEATSVYNFVPTYYTRATFDHLSPNDGWLVDRDNDKVPDIAIGRLPVRSTADLNAIIQKTKNYASRTDTGLVVAYDDLDDPFNKLYAKMAATSALHDGNNYVELSSAELGNYGVQKGIQTAFNNHVATMIVQTHGSATRWGGGGNNRYDFITASKIKNLNQDDKGTLIYAMTCYTTFFASRNDDSLSNVLMNSRFGAVAMAGSAVESLVQNNIEYTKRSLELTQTERKTIGQALTQARYETRNSPKKVISSVSWNLLGDPTIRSTLDNLR